MHTLCLLWLNRPDVDFDRAVVAVREFFDAILALHPLDAEIRYDVTETRSVAVDPRTNRHILPLVRAKVGRATYFLDVDDETFTNATEAANA